MNIFIHKLLQDLEYGLPGLNDIEALVHVRDAHIEMEAHIKTHHFTGLTQEILFYKVFRPRFLAYVLLYEIKTGRLQHDSLILSPNQHVLIEYYANGCAHLDQQYFSHKEIQENGFDTAVAKLLCRQWLANTRTKTIRRKPVHAL